MRSIAGAAGIFAESGRKQNRIHLLREIVPPNEFSREFVVGAVAQHELNLIVSL